MDIPLTGRPTDDSKPILLKLGFQAVTTTTPYVWDPQHQGLTAREVTAFRSYGRPEVPPRRHVTTSFSRGQRASMSGQGIDQGEVVQRS